MGLKVPKFNKVLFLIFLIAVVVTGLFLSFPSFLYSRTLVIADFERGSDPLNIDDASNITSTDVSVVTASYVAHSSSEPSRGRSAFSIKIRHLSTADAYLIIAFSPVDLRNYRSLNFWIRGAAGGEEFKINLRRATSPTEPAYRPNIKEFMIGGITTEWQKVNIPIKAIFKDFLTENYHALSDINGIILNPTSTWRKLVSSVNGKNCRHPPYSDPISLLFFDNQKAFWEV